MRSIKNSDQLYRQEDTVFREHPFYDLDREQPLASEGDAALLHGMVIIAEEQTGGIGRLGRSWVSPIGGVWITVVLKPRIPIDRVFMVTMAGSVAVARAIRKEFDLGALIKWPNDIYIGDKKVAGLILEPLMQTRTTSITACSG